MSHDTSRPVFGTREWAKYNHNCMNGCQHDCLYCYAKTSALKHKKISKPEEWVKAEVMQGKVKRKFGKREGTTMFPTQHDMHPDNLDEILITLEHLLVPGNDVLIVSKPHVPVIWAICNHFKQYSKQILFRFTIGSVYDKVLKFWEPNAPGFEERLVSLMIAYMMDYNTSISCEPMLDNKIQEVVDEVRPYVTDAIWLGKANFLEQRLRENGQATTENMKEAKKLLKWQDDDENIKTLYEYYKDDELIKWKESIKKIVGLEIPTEDGLDV